MHIHLFKQVILSLVIALLVGCAASVRSSAGLYGNTPGNLKDSDEKAMLAFDVMGHDSEDIRYAIKKAAGLDGFIIDVDRNNMLSGYGLSSGPEAMRCPNSDGYVFAAYINKISKKETKVTIVVDALGFCFGESNPAQFVAQKLMSNTNKILLTYE